MFEIWIWFKLYCPIIKNTISSLSLYLLSRGALLSLFSRWSEVTLSRQPRGEVCYRDHITLFISAANKYEHILKVFRVLIFHRVNLFLTCFAAPWYQNQFRNIDEKRNEARLLNTIQNGGLHEWISWYTWINPSKGCGSFKTSKSEKCHNFMFVFWW